MFGIRSSSSLRPMRASLPYGEGQLNVFRCLLELSQHGFTSCFGEFAQGLGLVDAGKRNRYRYQAAIVPIEPDSRFDTRRFFEIAFNGLRVVEPRG